MVGSVRVSWFNSFIKSALSRGYVWEIDIEFIDAMYEEQDGLCSLSGLPIGWSKVGWHHSASIDRIDSNKGYTTDNVQLVHKKLNMMKGTLSNEEFIELCTAVSENMKT